MRTKKSNAEVKGPKLPVAARSIEKGVPLRDLLSHEAVSCLAHNLALAHHSFDKGCFVSMAMEGLEPLGIMDRGRHIAKAMRHFLPPIYRDAVRVIVESLTPERTQSEEFSLAEFFYLPHSFFISEFGHDREFNDSHDPFDLSMTALLELTKRFTSEFAIRTFLVAQQERVLSHVQKWISDPNPHVRRLCSEGTRPRLPWGIRIPALILDPRPTLPILDGLKNDSSLYVRRSVANHLGDIAKDHPDIVFELCTKWLSDGASPELKWLIRHAVRYPDKHGNATARAIRIAAGHRNRRFTPSQGPNH